MPQALPAYGIDIFLFMYPAWLRVARCFAVNYFYNNPQPRISTQLSVQCCFSWCLAGPWMARHTELRQAFAFPWYQFHSGTCLPLGHTLYGFSGSQSCDLWARSRFSLRWWLCSLPFYHLHNLNDCYNHWAQLICMRQHRTHRRCLMLVVSFV